VKIFGRIAEAIVFSFWSVCTLALIWLLLVLAEVLRPDYQR
jgi:hypothetical protein